MANDQQVDPSDEEQYEKWLDALKQNQGNLNPLFNKYDSQNQYGREIEPRIEDKIQSLVNQREKLIDRDDDFWVLAFRNHPDLSQRISKEDEAALDHLRRVRINLKPEREANTGRELLHRFTFYFDKNPYFENTTLTKSVYLIDGNHVSEGDEINWKKGRNLIQLREEGGDENELQPVQSFFTWFVNHHDPDNNNINATIQDLWRRPFCHRIGCVNEGLCICMSEDEQLEDKQDEEENEEPKTENSSSRRRRRKANDDDEHIGILTRAMTRAKKAKKE